MLALCLRAVGAEGQEQETSKKSAGTGFFWGAGLTGGQLGFQGAEGLRVAVGDVSEYRAYPYAGVIEVRDAAVVESGAVPADAVRVEAFPSGEPSAGLAAQAGWAFSRRLAVVFDLELLGNVRGGFSQFVGGISLRCSPSSRLWVAAGPSLAQVVYGYKDPASPFSTTTADQAITGQGVQVAAGLALVSRPLWALELQGRFAENGFEQGFRTRSFSAGLAYSRRPR